jgi:hypothetical protein
MFSCAFILVWHFESLIRKPGNDRQQFAAPEADLTHGLRKAWFYILSKVTDDRQPARYSPG